MFIIIVGDASETRTCAGPFPTRTAAFTWAYEQGYTAEQVNCYEVLAPQDFAKMEK
jgi:hypothetical protein